MREDEKAARTVAAVTDGNGQMSLEGVRIPANDYITAFSPEQGTIASLLLRGRKNSISCRELSRITGLDRRQITRMIQQERLHGSPILSDTSGFWIAENEVEAERCIKSLHCRAGEIHRTARAIEDFIRSGGE